MIVAIGELTEHGAAEVQADVSLEPRDPTALAAFASAVSTPGSPQYHHYLAPGQFATTPGVTAVATDGDRVTLGETVRFALVSPAG